MSKNKKYLNERELYVDPENERFWYSCLPPVPAYIAVTREGATGYANAMGGTLGVLDRDPFRVLFHVWNTSQGVQEPRHTYFNLKENAECVIAIPGWELWEKLWIASIGAPRGIDELELARLRELPSRIIGPPGVAECPVNLECRITYLRDIPESTYAVVIADVVGVTVRDLRDAGVASNIADYPIQYRWDMRRLAPEVMPADPLPAQPGNPGKTVFFDAKTLQRPENGWALSAADMPMPVFFMMSADKAGAITLTATSRVKTTDHFPNVIACLRTGTTGSAEEGRVFEDIVARGEMALAMPGKQYAKKALALLTRPPLPFADSGFTALPPCGIGVHGVEECPVNLECRVTYSELAMGYGVLVAQIVGASQDRTILELSKDRIADIYPVYEVLGRDLSKHVGWLAPDARLIPKFPQNLKIFPFGRNINYWLYELKEENIISEAECNQVRTLCSRWNRLYFSRLEQEKKETRKAITHLLTLLCWKEWDEFHQFMRDMPSGMYVYNV